MMSFGKKSHISKHKSFPEDIPKNLSSLIVDVRP